MPIYVECEVYGGATGHRTGLLKQNGQVRTFDTLEEAEAEASRLDKAMNNAYAVATFRYRAVAR